MNWPVVRLGEFATPVTRVRQNGDAPPVLSISKHEGFVRSSEYFKKVVHSQDLSKYKLVTPGDFAFSPIYLDEGSIGLASEAGLISPMYRVFKIDPEACFRDYLIRILKSDQMVALYGTLGDGSVHRRRSVPWERLRELEVPLPPLGEQKRIAGVLDQADALRRLRARALDKLNTLGEAIFQEMFGDFPNGQALENFPTLGEFLLDVKNGISRRANDNEEQKDIVLRLRDIRELQISFSDLARISLDEKEKQRFALEKGDLLFVRVNGNADYVGRNAVFQEFNEPVYFNDHIMRVRVSKEEVMPLFLSFVLNSRFGKRQIAQNRKTSAGQHTINQDGLSSIHIPVPSLELQSQFVDALDRIDFWRKQLSVSLLTLDTLFASLQHRAFRGEL